MLTDLEGMVLWGTVSRSTILRTCASLMGKELALVLAFMGGMEVVCESFWCGCQVRGSQ